MSLLPTPSIEFLAACLLFALQIVACGEPANDLVTRGNAAYGEGKYGEALTLYDEASVTAPESAGIHFNRGAVHYRMEDFASAAEAFKKAAVRAKDPALSSQAKYNLGNCAFRNAQRQRDSDLKKAIEHCEESIAHYQEARDLDPDYREAAENIEIVRLYVKVLLDEQKKKQEEQEQQQEQQENLVEKLKKLIVRQNQLMAQTEGHRVARPNATDAAALESWTESLKGLQKEESTLQQDTGAVLVEMRQTVEQIRQQGAAGGTPGTQPQPTSPEATAFAEKVEVASGHLGNAMTDEQLAENDLASEQLKSSLTHQANAVLDLEEAVKALADDQQQDQQQQQQSDDQNQDQEDQDQQEQEQNQPDQEQNQQDQQQNEQNQEQEQQSEGDQSEQEEQQQQEAEARAERADDILDEEKENQKQRHPVRPGQGKPVDRDW